MKTMTVGLVLVANVTATTLSYAQSDIDTSTKPTIIQTHLIASSVEAPNYHQYALAKAKARWGNDKPYSDAQNKAIKDIEAAYIELDKDKQQQLNKITQTNLQPLLSEKNTDYIEALTAFYQTEIGKQKLGQKSSFETNKSNTLTNLPTLLSQQIVTNIATTTVPLSLSSTQP